ncbi:MAG: hypothetical protein M1824_006047 [Vezdaea acicularis]|nr:MAG: hypothetical protein M1824_006047 [Vezdaea acicularis]
MASDLVKHEWIVILPDHEGALEKRMAVRPAHLDDISSKRGNFWKLGGTYLDEVPKEGEALKFRGSILLALAESKEEVVDALKSDVYFKTNVWDWEKVIYTQSKAVPGQQRHELTTLTYRSKFILYEPSTPWSSPPEY